MIIRKEVNQMENITCNSKVVLVGGSSSRTMAMRTCTLCDNKDPHVVILPTARGDDQEIIDETYGFYSQFSSNVDVIKLVKETPTKDNVRKRVLAADLIYVPGGSEYSIKEYWKKYGIDKLIYEVAEIGHAVLVGSSAGAMSYTYASLFCNENDEPKNFYGFGLIPVFYSPHYQMKEYQGFDKALTQKNENIPGFTSGDDAGILCTPDGKYYAFWGEENNSVWRFDHDVKSGKWIKTEFKPPETVDINTPLLDITP